MDTRALTSFVTNRVVRPERTILWGASMGSVVTLKMIEQFPAAYDAAIAVCSVGTGTPRAFDNVLDLSVGYDTAFGWPEAWGSVGDVRDDVDFAADVLPVVLGEFTLVQTYTGAVGHCNFTTDQMLASVAAVDHWLETRESPGPDFFPAELGFVPGFDPGSFPPP